MSPSLNELTRSVFMAEELRHANTSHPKATTVSHYIPLVAGCAYVTPEFYVNRRVSSENKPAQMVGISEETTALHIATSFFPSFYSAWCVTHSDSEQ